MEVAFKRSICKVINRKRLCFNTRHLGIFIPCTRLHYPDRLSFQFYPHYPRRPDSYRSLEIVWTIFHIISSITRG